MIKRILICCLCFLSFAVSDVFKNSSSLIFTLPTNKWQFEFSPERYGVSAAGFLAGQRWTSSPVIMYCEIIPTNYQFEIFTKIQNFNKTSKVKDAKYQQSNMKINSAVPYEITFWSVKDMVYEYVAYFSLNKELVASIVMSSKREDILRLYAEDYRTVLNNFAKIARGYK